jgi:hypothetical protein
VHNRAPTRGNHAGIFERSISALLRVRTGLGEVVDLRRRAEGLHGGDDPGGLLVGCQKARTVATMDGNWRLPICGSCYDGLRRALPA